MLATFDRREAVGRCVAALLGQSAPPWRVYVADNASTDGTAAALRDAFGGRDNFCLLRLASNLGNPAAVARAMAAALADGADRVWVLDDDALPQGDALERLLAADPPADAVYASLIVEPATGEMAFPVAVLDPGGQRIAAALAELPVAARFRVRGAWLGALIPRAIIERVGPVEGALFLRGEDEDYPARIREAGFAFWCVPASRVEHPGQRLARWSVGGMNFFYEPGLALWKAFYLVRNHAYVRRRYAGSAVAGWAKGLATVVLAMVGALLLDDRKLRRCAVYCRAGWHGLTGRLGKTVEPGSL